MNPLIAAIIIAIIISGANSTGLLNENKISARKTAGIDKRKLILKAFSGLNPSNNKMLVVTPLLLIPGTTENP